MPYRVTWIDWALLASLVVAWGSSFVMSKIALQHIDPHWVAAARLVVGGLVLLAISMVQRSPLQHDSKSLRGYAWLGFIGNALPFVLITWGIQHVTSGVAGLLMGTIPLIVIAMAHFSLPGERLTLPRTLGFILGFVGILVLMGPQNLMNIASHGRELVGQIAIVAGCVCYGVNSISVKKMAMPGTIANTAGVLLAGAVMATVWASFVSPFTLFNEPASALWAVLGLGLIPTGFATAIWFKAVERTSPTFTSMSNYLVPIYALLFGAAMLGETVGLHVIAALALVLAGIFVSRLRIGKNAS